MGLAYTLALTYVVTIIFILLAYYGLCIRLWGAICMGLLFWIVLAMIVVPLKELVTMSPSIPLAVYVISYFLAIGLILIYVVMKATSDRRPQCDNWKFP